MKQDFVLKTTKADSSRLTKLSPRSSDKTRERFKSEMFETLRSRLKIQKKRSGKRDTLVSLRLKYKTGRKGKARFVSLPLAEIQSEAHLKILIDELVDGFQAKTGEYAAKGMNEVLLEGTEMQVYEK